MKTLKGFVKFLIGMLMLSYILTGSVIMVFVVKGVELGVASMNVSASTARWVIILAALAYVVTATVIMFLLLTDWYRSKESMDAEKAKAEKTVRLYESAKKEWGKKIESLLWTEIIEGKALRSKTTNEWYIWNDDINEWCTRSQPDLRPPTATIEDLRQIMIIPEDAELKFCRIIF